MGLTTNVIDGHEEFPLDPALSYLNHAAVAPWPARTYKAVKQFAQENTTHGAAHYERWIKQETRLRKQLCELINAPSLEDIALQKNTSEGLSVIAYGLSWQPGDEIVITDQEFPSNRIVWESLASQGAQVRVANIGGEAPEAAIIALLNANTRLLSVSSVQYGTGLRLDLHRLGNACRERNILFCVDAIQSLGALPFDVQACQADFVVADGHKWLLGPEGLALMYVNAAVRERLTIRQFGWHMVEHAGDYSRTEWVPARSAKRFECGSPNMLGAVALSASLSLLLEIGIPVVHARLKQRVQYLVDGLLGIDSVQILSPLEESRRAGIVTFKSMRISSDILFSSLKAQGIICAPRGGGIRFSPHFYTPTDALDRAIQAVARITA